MLRVAGLAVARGGRVLLHGLDFTLAGGQALVLRGPNGAGKTSLLRTIAGLLPAAGGRILWQDADVAEDPEAHGRRLRYVGHQDGLKGVFTVAENLAFAAALAGVATGARTAAVAGALAAFGLEALGTIPAGLLSAGQKRRAGLGRLLVAPAPLWLLDEPTVTLDADAVARLEAALRVHLKGGGLVIAATHAPLDLPAATTLALGRA